MIDHEEIYASLAINNQELSCELIKLNITSAIDQPFICVLTLAAKDGVAFFQKNIHEPACLCIRGVDTQARYFKGVLSSVSFINKNIFGEYVYELTIKPAVALYQDGLYQFLFNGISVLEIAKQILRGKIFNIATTAYQDYEVRLLGDRDYAPLYRILVRDESLLAFLRRILNYQGLSFYFDYTQKNTPLVMTDALNKTCASISAKYIPNSPHALTLNPYVETIQKINNSKVSQTVLTTGAPRLEPNMLLAESAKVLGANIATIYHVNTNEQLEDNAQRRADIASLALQNEERTVSITGGGLMLAGMKMTLISDDSTSELWLIRKSHVEITFDEHDIQRLSSMTTQVQAQDANIRHQVLPQFGEHANLISGVNLGTPSIDRGVNLMSVNEQGHYHITLPEAVSSNTEAEGVQLFDIRMLHPMHSNDHSSHMTLPTGSEGTLLWSEGFSGEPLILGTINNTENIHPTTDVNPQNAYWQDNDTNKLGFVNEGTYTPFQKTGRNTASIMEAPSYDPEGNKSYVRMGDAIANDTKYASQAAESGLFINTSGNYQEEHQGGLLTLAGNLNQNNQEDGFTPTLRHMVQISPTAGTYHILDSSTVHVHDETLTSDNVTEMHHQDASTINKSLIADQNLQNYYADTIDNIYVNQKHQNQGDFTSAIYNTHTLHTQSMVTNIAESGDITTESHDTHTINLSHSNNQVSTVTHQAAINNQATKVTKFTQNFASYIGAATSLSSNAVMTSITASNIAAGGDNHSHNAMLSINNGSATANIPNMTSLNEQGVSAIQDEKASEKKEIAFLLDCPQQAPNLGLCVNNINPQNIPANRPYIYPLNDQQKKGTIMLNAKVDSQEINSVIHKQIRNINLQYDAPIQQPNPWFSPSGKLPAYVGNRILDNQGLDFSDNDQNIVMLLAKNAPPDQCLKGGGFSASSVNDDVISWIMAQLSNANKTYPYNNADTTNNDDGSDWKWRAPKTSDYIGLVKDGVTTFTSKYNREFVLEFFNKGQFYVKEVRGEWMLIFKGRAGTRKWIQGVKYSLDSPKVKIFKVYAMMKSDKSGMVKSLDLMKETGKATPLNLLLIAPVNTIEYFFFNDDPNKQISDLFTSIGIDVFNTEIAWIVWLIFIMLSPIEFSAGLIIFGGVIATAFIGWLVDNVEDNLGIKNKFIEMSRAAQDHFSNQDDQLKINLQTLSSSMVQILTGA